MSTAVFLQVRLDSTRFPRKALALLGGKTVFERCLEALDQVRTDRHVVVTEPASRRELEGLAEKAGWEIYAGSKENVLDRYVQAGRHFGVSTIVRATGDNPLVSARLANLLLERHLLHQADYSGFQGGPVGSGVEILNLQALEKAWNSHPDAEEREHVSPFLYRRPTDFRVDRPPVPQECLCPDARVTLDTPEDWEYLQLLWKENQKAASADLPRPLEIEELIPWLKSHPR